MRLFILSFLLFFNQTVCGQVHLDSAKIYHYFESMGMTTMGSKSHFADLAKQNYPATFMNNRDLSDFNLILNSTPSKRHRQTKIGMNNVYILGYIGDKEQRIVIASKDLIINFGNLRQYHISIDSQNKINKIIAKCRE